MPSDACGHKIFDPSTSWIKKAGVHVNYAPEDTLKSAIFFSKERPGENGEGIAKELQEVIYGGNHVCLCFPFVRNMLIIWFNYKIRTEFN